MRCERCRAREAVDGHLLCWICSEDELTDQGFNDDEEDE